MGDVRFVKMQGIGNDFVVLDCRAPEAGGYADGRMTQDRLTGEVMRRIADRRRGIGCDQVLVFDTARRAGTDVFYRVFNADGHEVQQCGNGVRCLARLLHDAAPASGQFVLDSIAGPIHARIDAGGQVAVEMPEPDFRPSSLPFDADAPACSYSLDTTAGATQISIVSMGNPHAVVFVPSVADAPVAALGRSIQTHPRFAEGVNAGFCQIEDREHLRLRVFERGAGETLACGTGACAAVAVARNLGKVDARVEVSQPGGVLMVSWEGVGAPLWMSGPAETVFEGHIRL